MPSGAPTARAGIPVPVGGDRVSRAEYESTVHAQDAAFALKGRLTSNPINRTGATLANGAVVRASTADDNSVVYAGADNVEGNIGIVVEGGAANLAPVPVTWFGEVALVNVIGGVARGDYLQTSVTNGSAKGSATPIPGTFGRALTTPSGGQVRALILQTGGGGVTPADFSAHTGSAAVHSATLDQSQAPANNGPYTLQAALDRIANRIKAITGATNWYDAPGTTLANAATHIAAASPHSGHVVGAYTAGNALGNVPVSNGTVNTNLNADLLDGYHAGNASGQVPVSNGTVNTNLNADLLDGYHAGTASGQVPISNGTVNTNLNADMVDGWHGNQGAVASTVAVRDINGYLYATYFNSSETENIATAPARLMGKNGSDAFLRGYGATGVLEMLKTVDGLDSGLDAGLLGGIDARHVLAGINPSNATYAYDGSDRVSTVTWTSGPLNGYRMYTTYDGSGRPQYQYFQNAAGTVTYRTLTITYNANNTIASEVWS